MAVSTKTKTSSNGQEIDPKTRKKGPASLGAAMAELPAKTPASKKLKPDEKHPTTRRRVALLDEEARDNDDGQDTGKTKTIELLITPPNIQAVEFLIQGTAPYVQNRFSEKALAMMKEKQMQGSKSAKGAKKKPKDFQECYEGAKHISEDGWIGIPAAAFRNASVDACRLVGFKMTHAKLGIFAVADGFDRVDGTPLIKFANDEQPRHVEHGVKNESGVADIRARPLWASGWQARVTIEFDADMFSMSDIFNLMLRVGRQVGIGEGRPNSKKSCGMGWGTFKILEKRLMDVDMNELFEE